MHVVHNDCIAVRVITCHWSPNVCKDKWVLVSLSYQHISVFITALLISLFFLQPIQTIPLLNGVYDNAKVNCQTLFDNIQWLSW